MKKIKIILFSLFSLAVVGCTEYDCVQTTPNSASTNFSNCVPQVQLCDICANQTTYKIQPLNQANLLTKPKINVSQNIININRKPICSCNKLPMVPANYFVTYEPINNYPVTYKAKYIESCICY